MNILKYLIIFTGVFGEIRYSISGEQVELFTMDVITGELKVASGAIIDREAMDDIWLQAMAVDNAPVAARKTATVAVSSIIIMKHPFFSSYKINLF